MLSFVQLLEELSSESVRLAPDEVARLRQLFGDKPLQMGHLDADGSIPVPLDCLLEAIQAIGLQHLGDTVHLMRGPDVAALLGSTESLIDQVSAARSRKLARLVEAYQNEPDNAIARRQWKNIEHLIFGVDLPA